MKLLHHTKKHWIKADTTINLAVNPNTDRTRIKIRKRNILWYNLPRDFQVQNQPREKVPNSHQQMPSTRPPAIQDLQ